VRSYKQKLQSSWKRFKTLLDRNSGKISGGLVMPGDIMAVLSGLDFNNWGRILGSAVGLMDNVSQMIWGDKPRPIEKHKQSLKEPQDLNWFGRAIRYWQFWKYPWEFSGMVAIFQGVSAMVLAGPDTATMVGEALDVEQMVSREEGARLSEIFGGATLLVGCACMFVREESARVVEAAGRKKLGAFGLKKEFDACAEFVRNRSQELYVYGARPQTLRRLWEGAIQDVSYAGPNAVAARWLQVGLPFMAFEAVQRGDPNMFGSAVLYMVSNAFLANSTKRIDTHHDDLSPAPQNTPS